MSCYGLGHAEAERAEFEARAAVRQCTAAHLWVRDHKAAKADVDRRWMSLQEGGERLVGLVLLLALVHYEVSSLQPWASEACRLAILTIPALLA